MKTHMVYVIVSPSLSPQEPAYGINSVGFEYDLQANSYQGSFFLVRIN